MKNKKLIAAITAAISAFLYAFFSPEVPAQIGGGGVGGFPTDDWTLNGTLTGEQITSTDDIDYNGTLTNNVTDFTTFFNYILFDTSDYATDGSRFAIQKSGLDYAWTINSDITAGTSVLIQLNPSTETLILGDSTDNVQINDVDVTAAQGSFTGTTVNSCASEDTGNIDWMRFGNLIILIFDSIISCTSDSTTFTIDGAPAALTPSNQTGVGQLVAFDNGSPVNAGCSIGTDGDIDIVLAVSGQTNYLTNQWTASGTKGIPIPSVCIMVDNDNI